MIYTIYSEKDATIYEKSESMNTGTDSLLELMHESSQVSKSFNSRILIKFDVSDIENRVNAGKISQNAKYYLALKSVDAREIPQEYSIYAYPLSSSWTNGSGKMSHKPLTTDGVSWKYKTSKAVGSEWSIPPVLNQYEWDNVSMTWVDANILFGVNLSANVTSSWASKKGGGTWWDYDTLEAEQEFSHQTADVYMDVTQIIKKWITGSGRFENDGMLIKFSDELEKTPESLVSLKFFSTDSNTIYVPRLHVVWNDSSYSTGSLSNAVLENLNINVRLKKNYAESEKAKIRIYANTRYPEKNYTTQSYQTTNYYLPSSSYYEVRDAFTDEIILPFDISGSKVSCDSTSSYFNLWMNSFQPERFYRVVLKVESAGGDNVQIFDNNYYFKVTR